MPSSARRPSSTSRAASPPEAKQHPTKALLGRVRPRGRAAAAGRRARRGPERAPGPRAARQVPAVFSFLYFLKLKFHKYMSVLKYFKNISRLPAHRATGLKCNFFLQIRNEVPEKKDLSPVGGATGACRPAHGRPPLGPAHRRGRGPVAPPRATGVPTPIKGLTLPFPPHLSLKIPPKIQKKREE